MQLVQKTWGYEKWIWNEAYCGKLLVFHKDKRCSFHYHPIKDEVLYLQSGKILMKFAEHDDLDTAEAVILEPGAAFHVTPGMRHQMIALEDSVIFEMSTHHDEADSIRVVLGSPPST